MTKSSPDDEACQRLAVIVGPTASGKSELALQIARKLAGEIVNFDSIQVYRGFDIGSAKLLPSERLGIPHHLIDIAGPEQVFTAGEFARVARQTLHDIGSRGRVPVLVGGTGFYLRALLDGLSPQPQRDEAIRARLAVRERKRPGSLHRILSRLDCPASERIHANDTQKLIRAVEICLLPRSPLAPRLEPLTGFAVTKFGLDPPRSALCERIDLRVAQMFERGLLGEVESLLANGVSRTAKPFESLGYAQALECLDGKVSREQAIASTQLATRQYAKRQMTWFRRERDVDWFRGFGSDPLVQAQALQAT